MCCIFTLNSVLMGRDGGKQPGVFSSPSYGKETTDRTEVSFHIQIKN